jgi:hypothetical protein
VVLHRLVRAVSIIRLVLRFKPLGALVDEQHGGSIEAETGGSNETRDASKVLQHPACHTPPHTLPVVEEAFDGQRKLGEIQRLAPMLVVLGEMVGVGNGAALVAVVPAQAVRTQDLQRTGKTCQVKAKLPHKRAAACFKYVSNMCLSV